MNVFDVAGLLCLRVMLEVERTIFEPFLIGFDLSFVLGLHLLVSLLGHLLRLHCLMGLRRFSFGGLLDHEQSCVNWLTLDERALTKMIKTQYSYE